MITVSVKLKDEALKKFITRLSRLKTGPRELVKDLHRLGEDCYKDFKQVIPVSKYPKPHLRSHFSITVKKVEGIYGPQLILSIFPNPADKFLYATYINKGATIPVRYPKSKRAMKFIGKGGNTVFAKKAKGFKLPATNYVKRGERFLKQNIWSYVDRSLQRYIK
jgi:hypothetical protein